MSMVEVKVPDIGDFKEVEVIELMVKVGDTVKVDQSLITVESDKASMEIPSSQAGVIKEIKVKVGDKVSEGSLLLVLDSAVEVAAAPAPAAAAPAASVHRLLPHRRLRQRCQPRRCAGGAAPAPAAAPSAAAAGGRLAACVAIGAQVRARAWCRFEQGGRHGSQGTHYPG